MSGKASQAKTLTPEQRQELQAQEIGRLRDLLREQTQTARSEARADMRARYRIAIAGLTGAALLAGGLIGRYGLREPRPAGDATAQVTIVTSGAGRENPGEGLPASATPWPLRVHVSGAVAESGVVELPAGSLVADAIEAAGGPAPDADLDAVNLAAPVEDNAHLSIPHLDAPAPPAAEPGSAPMPSQPIDINSASAADLAALPYIGEAKAAAIVAHRRTYGAFTHIEQIQEVPGIGTVIFEHIAEFITVEP